MIARSSNGIDTLFGFSYKSHVLTDIYRQDICALCLCFFEDFANERDIEIKVTSFLKEYNYASDVENGVINHLIIILPYKETCVRFAQSEWYLERHQSRRLAFIRNKEDITYLTYNDEGTWASAVGEIKKLSLLVKEIKIFGFYNIFEKGNGILVSGPSHHYILQNQSHSNKFIRTANILTDSIYVDFIALFLLDFISDVDRQIYIDTSGIISIPYAVNKLKAIFGKNGAITTESFNSYEGFKNLPVDANVKILISASTSGKLSKELIDRGFDRDKIKVLFYLNKLKAGTEVLCDLDQFSKVIKDAKYSPFIIEPEANCTLCQRYSYPIKIVGEQFLPEELKVDTFSFDLKDRPIWLSAFMRDYFNKSGFIKCYYRTLTKDIKRDIFINFEEIFRTSNGKLDRFCSSKLPNDINVLVYYQDPGTVALKEIILSKYKSSKDMLIIPETEINSNREKLTGKNILIVSSTLINGNRFVETSLKLRDTDCSGICYFIGMSRTPDNNTIDTTRQYVGFDNRFGREINPLVIVESIFVSDVNTRQTFIDSGKSSWESEISVLQESTMESIFKTRIADLSSETGLEDNLFWGNHLNHKLKLRKNFAFYTGLRDLDTQKTTQAEVFFIINTVLHNLRQNPNKKLLQSPYHRDVVSPEMFICYNDGIIQSSILRSANPLELNYNLLGKNSKIGIEMIYVLEHIFNNVDNEAGEATIEFLIAIATKRLQLIGKEQDRLITNLISKMAGLECENKGVILGLCKFINRNSNGTVV
jgi:hypothetical protein